MSGPLAVVTRRTISRSLTSEYSMPSTLYLLALAVFVMGTSEFMLAGLLTSAFAVGMVVGAPAVRHDDRHGRRCSRRGAARRRGGMAGDLLGDRTAVRSLGHRNPPRGHGYAGQSRCRHRFAEASNRTRAAGLTAARPRGDVTRRGRRVSDARSHFRAGRGRCRRAVRRPTARPVRTRPNRGHVRRSSWISPSGS